MHNTVNFQIFCIAGKQSSGEAATVCEKQSIHLTFRGAIIKRACILKYCAVATGVSLSGGVLLYTFLNVGHRNAEADSALRDILVGLGLQLDTHIPAYTYIDLVSLV